MISSIPRARAPWALIAAGALAACAEANAGIDPDDPAPRDVAEEQQTFDARLRTLELAPLIAASGGITEEEAPAVLAGWLSATAGGRALLARWPRRSDGALDLGRAPVRARDVRAIVDRASRSRCGEVLVLLRGALPPTMRVRVPLPATARACRGSRADVALEGLAAVEALDEAVAAGATAEPFTALP